MFVSTQDLAILHSDWCLFKINAGAGQMAQAVMGRKHKDLNLISEPMSKAECGDVNWYPSSAVEIGGSLKLTGQLT